MKITLDVEINSLEELNQLVDKLGSLVDILESLEKYEEDDGEDSILDKGSDVVVPDPAPTVPDFGEPWEQDFWIHDK